MDDQFFSPIEPIEPDDFSQQEFEIELFGQRRAEPFRYEVFEQ